MASRSAPNPTPSITAPSINAPSINAPSINVVSSSGISRGILKAPDELRNGVSVLVAPVNPDHTHTVSGDGVSPTEETRIMPMRANFFSRRPALSRPPTETDIRHEESEKRIQRRQTEAHIGEPTSRSFTGHDLPKPLSKSHTEATVGSEKRKRDLGLADQITETMRMMGQIGLDEPKSYLPDEWLPKLMTDARIQRALKKPSHHLIEFSKNNPKIFAITLLVYTDKKSRTRAMNAFRTHNFTDSCLPFVEKISSPDICAVGFDWKDSDDESDGSDGSDGSADEMKLECRHKLEGYAFHGSLWTQTSYQTFFEKQWSFLIPKILEEEFEYHFGDHIILPFEKYGGEPAGAEHFGDGGHFGDVTPAIMLAKYQTAIETNNCTIPVAIKEMKSHLGEEYDNHGNWKREVKALIVFNKLNDEHIVRGIGAFTQRGKRFILMEYAQCGDLWKVWAKNRDPHLKLTEDRVEQFLEQFRGLANALNRMHDYKVVSLGATAGQVITKEQEIEAENSIESNQSDDADEPLRFQFQLSEFGDTEPKPKALETSTHENGGPESQEPATQGQQPHERKVHFQEPEHEAMTNTPTNPKATENWRHGDLKPDNILSFGEDGSSWLGTLKLADLGRARQHMDRTANRQGTNENFSTVPYDPPEVWTSLNEKGRSRLVDIWSFGCVLLESVIWLLFGFEELMRFRHRPTGFGSLYWTDESIHNKTAKLNDSTFEWINQLLKYDPEFMDSKKGSAMRDVILLIKNKLLLIKLPADYDVLEKDCRINSKGLVDELDEILRKGRQDPSYFFSGRDRAEIEAPQIAQTRPKEQKSDQFLSADVRLSSRNVIQNPTPAPWPARPESGYGERIDSYLHDFDDKWDYVEDNSFACRVANRLKIDVKQLLEQKTSILCDSCVSLNWKADTLEIKDSLAELRRRKVEERCELCAMMLRIAEKTPNMDWVEFDKSGSGLRINRSAGLPVLTIRQISVENQNQKALSDDPNSYIQTGLPKIPKGGSLAHFDIIKAWLDDCDKNHKRCLPMRPNLPPTRLIDVGTLELPSLRLVESSSLPQSERKLLKYIALSHPWGSSPPHVHFVTDNQNVKIHREKEIPNELPQTLADAIKTTRHLGVRYIWIDSICIIQGEGGDFAKEADRMEAVFSSAYCVIAATSAEGSSSGFLNRNSKRQLDAVVSLDDERQDPVCIPTRGTDGKATGLIFVDEPFDDFDRDVLRGSLNQRGWVFQERALARRTIHFTNNQAYWECGDGIRCETLTKMKNTRVGFLGDPNFPRYGMRGSKGGDIVFYEDLYEQYSNLAFSKFEDRPFAISGLEQRLSKALKEKGGSDLGYWGIFDDYWGRGLLWRRAAGVEKMARLTNGPSGGDAAPSWSWEGHSGGITFMKPDPHSVHWLSDEVILPWRRAQDPQARMTTASYHGERCLRGIARDFIILEKGQVNDVVKEDIIYDNDADRMERGPLKCLIIGRMNVKDRSREEVLNYILILAKKKSAPGNVYERIGAGFLDGSLIAFDENAKNVLVE